MITAKDLIARERIAGDKQETIPVENPGGPKMTAISITRPREPAVGGLWWVLLITGALWIVVGLYVLQAHYGSAVAIGYLVGFWLLFAGVAEFVETARCRRVGGGCTRSSA